MRREVTARVASRVGAGWDQRDFCHWATTLDWKTPSCAIQLIIRFKYARILVHDDTQRDQEIEVKLIGQLKCRSGMRHAATG